MVWCGVTESVWLLDAAPHPEGVLLWFKRQDMSVVAAVYRYRPSFYLVIRKSFFIHTEPSATKISTLLSQPVLPSMIQTKLNTPPVASIEELYEYYAQCLTDLDDVAGTTVVYRRVHAEDVDTGPVMQITVKSPLKLKQIVDHLRTMDCFEFYNVDIPVAQMFFYETGLFPFARCEVSWDGKPNSSSISQIPLIQQIRLQDSNEAVHYDLPPLRAIWLEFDVSCAGLRMKETDPINRIYLTVDPVSAPIPLSTLFPPSMITITPHGAPQIVINEDSEADTLRTFERAIRTLNPDLIFTHHGDESLFPHLLARVMHHRLSARFSLSRDNTPLRRCRFKLDGADSYMTYGQIIHRARTQFYLHGRLHIDSAIMGGLNFDDGNLYGIVEIARISYITLQRLTRVTIGGALQSMQFFEAYRQGVLIPEEKKNAENFRPAANLLLSDRGGYILDPQIGMFDRVAELDFTSMYPALMVEYNVSPEMVNCPCCQTTGHQVPGLPYHTCTKRRGLVPSSLRIPLEKRITYKKLLKTATPVEKKRYEQIQTALKWILVVCFGYLGFRNARFGRIEAHQTVCAYAREFLLNATEITEAHGLHYLHGIVDSLYVQAPPDMPLDIFHQTCKTVAEEISAKTQIPLEYDPNTDYFAFISFLPTKANPTIGALNRYWGVKPNGAIKVRGLELRRHDAPPLVKQFQEACMAAINQSTYRNDFSFLLRKTIMPVLRQYYTRLEKRQVTLDEITVSIRLTRQPHQYKVHNYQAIAAQKLAEHDLHIGPGQQLGFIIVDSKAANPEDRVIPVQLYPEDSIPYDVGKYKELLVRSLINLLPFQISPAFRVILEQISVKDAAWKMQMQVQSTLLPYVGIQKKLEKAINGEKADT